MNNDVIEQLRADLKTLHERLKTERDELDVQMHLARAEAREEWVGIEKQWQEFQHKAGAVAGSAAEASKDVAAAASLLGEELGNAYQRIRKALKN